MRRSERALRRAARRLAFALGSHQRDRARASRRRTAPYRYSAPIEIARAGAVRRAGACRRAPMRHVAAGRPARPAHRRRARRARALRLLDAARRAAAERAGARGDALSAAAAAGGQRQSGPRRSRSSSKATGSACAAAAAGQRPARRGAARIGRLADRPRRARPRRSGAATAAPALVGPGRVLGRATASRPATTCASGAAAARPGDGAAFGERRVDAADRRPARRRRPLRSPRLGRPAARADAHRREAVVDRAARVAVDPPSELVAGADRRADRRRPTLPEQARGALHFDLGGALPLVDVELRFAAGTRVAPVRLQGRKRADRALARPRQRRLLSARARRRGRRVAGAGAARRRALHARRCPTSARRRSTPATTRARRPGAARVARVRGAGPAAVPPARRLGATRPPARCRSRRWCRSSTTSARASAGPRSARGPRSPRSPGRSRPSNVKQNGDRCCCGRCCSSVSSDSAVMVWSLVRGTARAIEAGFRVAPGRFGRARTALKRRRAERANCT